MEKNWIHHIKKPIRAGALCIGAFDGIHLGHKALIKKTIEESGFEKAYGLSFSPHPREFFYNENSEKHEPFERVCPDEVNATLMESLGLERLFFVEFNKDLSKKNTNEFLNYVRKFIDFESLVVGFDFRLGSERKGGQEELMRWCEEHGVSFVSVPKVSAFEQKISSTLVRASLKKNDFQKAEELLGHAYFLEGKVVKDQGLGTKLGFSTMNLKLPKNLVLNNGVYAAVVQIDTKDYPAVINLGHRPTVENNKNEKTLEAHVLDGDFKTSVDSIRVYLKGFLRPEVKFKNVTDLSLQVQRDILDCKAFFAL